MKSLLATKLRPSTILGVALLGITSCGQATVADGLQGTSWQIQTTEGFPGGSLQGQTISFSESRFQFDDGVNSGSAPIAWSTSGFSFLNAGEATDVGSNDVRHLAAFIEVGADVTVQIDDNGRSLQLRQGSFIIEASK